MLSMPECLQIVSQPFVGEEEWEQNGVTTRKVVHPNK